MRIEKNQNGALAKSKNLMKRGNIMQNKEGNGQKPVVSDWLYQFMEEKAPWFWGIFSIVMVLGLYKTVSTTFMEKTPYVWDVAFLRIALSLLAIMMMREAYQGEFYLGFTTRGFGQGLLLCWPMLAFIAFNLFLNLSSGKIYGESLAMMLTSNFSIGLFEEVISRAILVGHMMHHWKDDVHRIRKSVVWSSVIFGVLHIGNIFSNPVGTLFQIVYATGVGILFSAVYLRTRNLWGCVIVHAINDFCAGINALYVPLQADMDAYSALMTALPQIFVERIPEETLLAIVPLLQLAAIPISIFIAIVGIYMVRPAKAKQINQLWA